MKTAILIPTYNEKDNIEKIIKKIHSIDKKYHIIIIDDNSPDKTGSLVKKIMKKNKSVFLIERKEKNGIGPAYITGFKYAVKKKYDYIVQMDADFSHNPESIPEFIKNIKKYDLVIGSRYISGINVINWPLKRLLLSYFANVYARIVTGVKITDLTGGFKCFKRKVLESIDFDKIKSNGYSFQIEMNYLTYKKGFKVKEVPIIFIDRINGKSKMSYNIIAEALLKVLFFRFKNVEKK